MSVDVDIAPFDRLTWTNRFTGELPADASDERAPRQVPGAAFSRVRPTPVAAPRVLAWSAEMAAELGLDLDAIDAEHAAQVLSGNVVPAGADPHALRYGGHQFGNWAGQLGDGRAIALGEVRAPSGRHWTLQLKGAGRTPYSRGADGRAVLRSSVREFLCSEAMHHLGVPTTRALALVSTGDDVVRDMFYDGHPRPEPGAVVTRVAPSWVRFGSFEIPAAQGEDRLLARLVDHVIETDFTHLGAPSPEVRAEWFAEVARRTAAMIVDWQRVGFVHGVMNTDNMSILGLTIDYGPYGWLEDYDPGWTPNTTDAAGRRYRYGNQPQIGLWNLVRLANALLGVIDDEDALRAGLDGYGVEVGQRWSEAMAAKLGLERLDGDEDAALVDDLFETLATVETDMTVFFRQLADIEVGAGSDELSSDRELLAPIADAWYVPEQITDDVARRFASWVRRYLARAARDARPATERADAMRRVNPRFVLRNYLAQLAIDDAEAGDPSRIVELLDVLRRPYDDQPGREVYAAKRPDWARSRAGCSMLSCSS